MGNLSRRAFVTTLGAASVIPAASLLAETSAFATSSEDGPLVSPGNSSPTITYIFFNASESAFIEAACERLIPADESGVGATGAGVPNYLDKQLGGAWGAGERLYRSGPWRTGSPSQGYQLPFTPAELFRHALRSINQTLESLGTPFSAMDTYAQDTFLKSLESGAADLNGVPSAVFFDLLLKMTVEGFFSDPVYGGNRDMAAWRMIGFPGAYADYYDSIDQHGVKFVREPMSLGQDGHKHIHLDPNIPRQIVNIK
jgi:gluconate 2-dehydrogenase gamma chain